MSPVHLSPLHTPACAHQAQLHTQEGWLEAAWLRTSYRLYFQPLATKSILAAPHSLHTRDEMISTYPCLVEVFGGDLSTGIYSPLFSQQNCYPPIQSLHHTLQHHCQAELSLPVGPQSSTATPWRAVYSLTLPAHICWVLVGPWARQVNAGSRPVGKLNRWMDIRTPLKRLGREGTGEMAQ